MTTQDETYRATLEVRTPEGASTTVIVTRQGVGRAGRTWVTLAGSIRCTAVLSDDQSVTLERLVATARLARGV